MNFPTTQFKALSDKTRFRIVYILKQSNLEICECDLAEILDTPYYSISRHLTILHNAGIIEKRKEGRWIFAFISKSLDTYIQKTLDAFIYIQEDTININIKKAIKTVNNNVCK